MRQGTQIIDFTLSHDLVAQLEKGGADHKYDHGHAMVVSGPPGQGGAARLAARGALRTGTGLVSLLCHSESVPEHAAQLNAVMVKRWPRPAELAQFVKDHKVGAICAGPALGLDAQAEAALDALIQAEVPLCLDADALTLLAREGNVPQLNAGCVMTPHEGEMKRLLPQKFDGSPDRVEIAGYAAKHYDCCVLFKGVDTIIARPDGSVRKVCSEHYRHAPWLATAGSGDVLAGMITGLMTRGMDAFDAAAVGADLHLRCAQVVGPGLIAEDIPEALPQVLAELLDQIPAG